MQFKRVMAVGVLVNKIEVGIVPGEPAHRACQQGGMQYLPVVIARMFIRGEIAADAKFFQHNWFAHMRKLAVESGAEMLARDIVIRGIGMGADKIDGARNLAQTKAVVAPRHFDSPRSVSGRYWLRGPGGAASND